MYSTQHLSSLSEIKEFVVLSAGHPLSAELLRKFRLFTEDPRARINITKKGIEWRSRGTRILQILEETDD